MQRHDENDLCLPYSRLNINDRRAYHAAASARWRSLHPDRWREVQRKYKCRIRQKKHICIPSEAYIVIALIG